MLQHIEDEALLDRLLHGVAVEGPALAGSPSDRLAEDLQRLVLRGGGEGEVAGVGQELARFHDAVDLVLECLVVFVRCSASTAPCDRRRGAPALAGVRLVDDDGEAAVRGARSPISSRMMGNFWTVEMTIRLPPSMKRRRSPECSACADSRPDLGELLDGVADLLVEDAAVGDDDDGIEEGLRRSCCRSISWCASQAMELLLPLPAECWIR